MKLAIFGATGKTGHQLVEQALAAGHSVHALARDPAKMRIQHENLRVIAGNALDPVSVAEAVQGTEVVLSALGIGAGNPEGAITQSVRNIVDAMHGHRLRRIIVMSSLGIGDSKGQIPLTFKMAILAIPILRATMADIGRMEDFIRGTDLDWIIVRPGGLQDKPARGDYQVSTGRELRAGEIPRADVAAFMLKQLTDATYVRQAPGIT
jgi:putative NADH-flavin reductase